MVDEIEVIKKKERSKSIVGIELGKKDLVVTLCVEERLLFLGNRKFGRQ